MRKMLPVVVAVSMGVSTGVVCVCVIVSWAARYNTWLLIN